MVSKNKVEVASTLEQFGILPMSNASGTFQKSIKQIEDVLEVVEKIIELKHKVSNKETIDNINNNALL